MQTLIALLVAAVAASAVARPPGPTAVPGPRRLREPPLREIQVDYMLPRLVLPQYTGYEDSPGGPPPAPDNDWLNKEIYRINQMDEYDDLMRPYNSDLLNWFSHNIYLQKMLAASLKNQDVGYAPDSIQPNIEDMKPMSIVAEESLPIMIETRPEAKRDFDLTSNPGRDIVDDASSDGRRKFALTPMDEGYYEPEEYRPTPNKGQHPRLRDSSPPRVAILLEPPRQTRQNPNLSKQKHLLEPDLGKLKTGLSHEEGDPAKQHHVHVLESASDPAESIYGVALIAAVGAALAMAIVGFAFGWYTLSKRAKAAADVDYPAYGVTGPTVDSSGDRKLAHSAHMYHYQHQKQQIIAMERNGLEQRAASVSDPESEEENEEGDYTVYECPGFATTGDMEVKNPLFSEDPTSVTPGKCEVVKPQPKD